MQQARARGLADIGEKLDTLAQLLVSIDKKIGSISRKYEVIKLLEEHRLGPLESVSPIVEVPPDAIVQGVAVEVIYDKNASAGVRIFPQWSPDKKRWAPLLEPLQVSLGGSQQTGITTTPTYIELPVKAGKAIFKFVYGFWFIGPYVRFIIENPDQKCPVTVTFYVIFTRW